MSMVFTLTLLAAVAQTGQPAKPVENKRCSKPGVEMTRIDTPRATPRKLGEMPPAKPFYTVVREIDGCPQNVSVPVARAHR